MAAGSDLLPHVDEHAAVIAAAPAPTWEALLRAVEGAVSSGAAPRFARLLGCSDTIATGPRPLAVGSAFPGFHVDVANAPPSADRPAPIAGDVAELALAGSHRFSRYALIFRLDDFGDGETRVRAETRAEFPGLEGRAYRAMVIGTRMHVLATNRILTAVKRRAERR